jgi:hypothetical protein
MTFQGVCTPRHTRQAGPLTSLLSGISKVYQLPRSHVQAVSADGVSYSRCWLSIGRRASTVVAKGPPIELLRVPQPGKPLALSTSSRHAKL